MEQKKLAFRFGEAGKYIPVLIAIIFIVIAGTHQSNVNGYCLAFFAAVIFGAPFAKDFTAYGEAAVKGLGRSIFAIISVAVIIAAINGKLVSSSGLIQSLAYLVVNSGMSGGVFAAMSFLICCVLSMATGTSVGTNVVCFPILFPVGVLVGVEPTVMAGALVSGALFGDNLAPISDTTIASANTQGADMGGVVRTRMKYSVTAAVLTFIAVLIFGGSGQTAASAAELTFNAKSLVMVLVPVVVITLCLLRQHLIVALSAGVITGILLGVVTGLYTFGDIFAFPGGWKVGGIFIDAITGTVGTVFMLYGVFMLLGIMEASGVLEDIAKVLQAVVRGKRSAETMTALSVGLLGWVTGVTAVGMVAVGDVIKELGEKFGVDKYRRANLMDCGGLAMTALAPWTVHAVLPASLANGAAEVAITPLGVVTHNYYCIILLIIIAVTIITRIGAENKEK
ncbi:MAG: hypothetical protein IJ773_02135 [Lachnospiraceae bacterium]|nr:hypothetical protein [Lachnospiraceae bacterium]